MYHCLRLLEDTIFTMTFLERNGILLVCRNNLWVSLPAEISGKGRLKALEKKTRHLPHHTSLRLGSVEIYAQHPAPSCSTRQESVKITRFAQVATEDARDCRIINASSCGGRKVYPLLRSTSQQFRSMVVLDLICWNDLRFKGHRLSAEPHRLRRKRLEGEILRTTSPHF